MLMNAAYAQSAGASPGGGDFMLQLMPLLLIFAVFYFLLIRPQQKKAKTHREMLAGLKRGDRVLTGGGIYGVVTKLDGDDALMVEVATGVRVRVARGTVADVVARGEPVDRPKKRDGDDEDAAADGGSDAEKKSAS